MNLQYNNRVLLEQPMGLKLQVYHWKFSYFELIRCDKLIRVDLSSSSQKDWWLTIQSDSMLIQLIEVLVYLHTLAIGQIMMRGR